MYWPKVCIGAFGLFTLRERFVNLKERVQQNGSASQSSILLVDDKAENLVALQAALQGLPAHLETRQSGEDALRCVLEQDFAVILLDIRMPGMDGFETARLIRMREQNKRTPIIFLTAYGDGDARIKQAYSLGAVDYIEKPFNAEILESKVKVFLDLHIRSRQANTDNDDSRNRERVLLELLSNQPGTSVTAGTFGFRPLRDAVPREFEQLVHRYCELLNMALDRRIYKENKIDAGSSENSMRLMAQDLGFLNAGPRDVIDLHLAALEKACDLTTTQKSNALAEEGRLITLELMGHLVSYYRNLVPTFRRNAP